MMTKLSDMQLVLLSTAAGRADGSLYPPAESLGARGDRIRRAVGALIKRALAAEIAVSDQARSWRHDGAISYGVVITDAGRIAIAVEMPPAITHPEPERIDVAAAPRAASKIAGVVALLERNDGATLAELMEATGWLPHTTRAALSGLRKKGRIIAKTPRDGATAYSIAVAA